MGCGWRDPPRRHVEGTNTAPADGVAWDIQFGAKARGRLAVQDIGDCVVTDVADRGVEETWPDSAVGFNYRRDPGRVAVWSNGYDLPEMGSKMRDNAPQLVGAFPDEPGINVAGMLTNHGLHLQRESFHLF